MVNPPTMRVLVLTIVSTAGLTGCSGTDPDNLRPWEETVKRSGSATLTKDYGSKLEEGKPHVVEKGDTLYSIAFRLGIDFRELAARNNIQPPYIIKVGQTLRTAKTVPQPEKQSSKVDLSRSISSKKSNKSVPKQSKVTSVTKPSLKSQALSDTVSRSQSVSRWHWPSAGRVIRMYSSNRHKGIDIAGKRGDPVKAVAAGKVVYAGTGVTGYGSLLIIKHNETYLSAYGHNERLLVLENTNIQAGQQIATMGSSGTDTVKLHFELRRRGRPIDPLTLLPRRR